MRELSVTLQDRELRFDGVSIIEPERLAELLLQGVAPNQLRVTKLDADTQVFNENVPEDDQVKVATPEPVSINLNWQLPQRYLDLDIWQHVGRLYEERAAELHQTYTPKQYDAALDRIFAELAEIERRGMVQFIQTLIYILDVFRERGVVWGVGRGSSCASYVLFLIGLHSVDCIRYDIPLTEFFHD